MSGGLERGRVERVLRRISWEEYGVCHVFLHGSLAKRGWGRDVDLLLVPCSPRKPLPLEVLVVLVEEVSEALGVDPDLVDLADAARADCPLIVEAWRHGVIIYTRSRAELLDYMLPRLAVCEDDAISFEKLDVVGVGTRRALERWR